MNERRFHREIERLRDPERVERMEVGRVVELSLAGSESPESMLDIGTGSGLFAEAFAARGMRVAGVDINPEMLPAAQGFVPTGTFKEGVAESLPFKDGEFDLAFMGLLLHETDDPLAAMREAYRVANKRLAVLEWFYEVQEIGPDLSERISLEKIQGWAKEAGFKVVKPEKLKKFALYLCEK
jgi:SAM-dependent methyltransferase